MHNMTSFNIMYMFHLLSAKTNNASTGVLKVFDSMSKLRKACVTDFFESLKLRGKMSFDGTYNASSGFPKSLCR